MIKLYFIMVNLILILGTNIYSQSIFTYESKVIDFRVPRDSKCYENGFLKIMLQDTIRFLDNNNLGLSWNPINQNEIVGCNVNYVGKYNLYTGEFDTIYKSSSSSILEISANESDVYIVTAPFENLRFENYQLVKVDLKNKVLKKIDIEKPVNVSNLCVSSNNKYLAFVNHQNYEADNLEKEYIMIYDLINSKIQCVDSVNQENGGWFCSIDDHSGLMWNDTQELLYFKHSKLNGIYRFNIATLKRDKVIDIPFERVRNFTFTNGDFYSVTKGQIQRYNNSGLVEIAYKVGYKYDYLENCIYMIK